MSPKIARCSDEDESDEEEADGEDGEQDAEGEDGEEGAALSRGIREVLKTLRGALVSP